MEEKEFERMLAANIYTELVVSEFYKESSLSYDALKAKATEAARYFVENQN